jgi:hypothetical protein
MGSNNGAGAVAGGGAIYGLGLIGAWIYFWQQADTVAGHLLSILEGLVWPAFVVFHALAALHV